MQRNTIRIATRNSPLALWQANSVRQQLEAYWPELEITLLPMTTSGDQFLKDKLLTIGNKGLFVKELEEALLDERADIAVHSMKDVPIAFPNGLSLATICKRDNPFDAFVSFSHVSLDALPMGAIIGTSSLRRQSQLLAIRPDLTIKSLRGNIHTRLNKLKQGEFDAIILAAAGLLRMNMQENIQEILDERIMLPACGQGALGIESRTDDDLIKQWLAPLHDPQSAMCVLTERHVNALLGGNCHTPLSVFCTIARDSTLLLRAKIANPSGRQIIESNHLGVFSEAISLAEECAQHLIQQGAMKCLGAGQR